MIHLLDAYPDRRADTAAVLARAGLTVAEQATLDDLLKRLAESLTVDCLIADLDRPLKFGLQIIASVREIGCRAPIIIIDHAIPIPDLVTLMRQGAVDYLMRPVSDERLLAAVREAMTLSIAAGVAAPITAQIHERFGSLTPREQEVLSHLLFGEPTRRIAEILGTSPRTVEAQRRNVLSKMGAANVAQLTRILANLSMPPHHPAIED